MYQRGFRVMGQPLKLHDNLIVARISRRHPKGTQKRWRRIMLALIPQLFTGGLIMVKKARSRTGLLSQV